MKQTPIMCYVWMIILTFSSLFTGWTLIQAIITRNYFPVILSGLITLFGVYKLVMSVDE